MLKRPDKLANQFNLAIQHMMPVMYWQAALLCRFQPLSFRRRHDDIRDERAVIHGLERQRQRIAGMKTKTGGIHNQLNIAAVMMLHRR